MRLAILAALLLPFSLAAQDARKEIQRYQQMIGEGSPVELFELEGETLWKKPQGPNKVSLEKCDLGSGPGVLKGAYARLPLPTTTRFSCAATMRGALSSVA